MGLGFREFAFTEFPKTNSWGWDLKNLRNLENLGKILQNQHMGLGFREFKKSRVGLVGGG